MKSLSYLNKYLWKYRKKLFLGILFIALSNLFAVYSARIVRWAFDLIAQVTQHYRSGEYQVPELLVSARDQYQLPVDRFFRFDSAESMLQSAMALGIWFALIYIGIYIIKGIFLFLTRQTVIVMSRYIEFDLKNEIFRHYQELNMAFYKRNNTGDLMNRISEDVTKVRMYLGPGIMYSINLVFLFVLTITFMINVNAQLTLFVLLPLPVMSVLIYYVSRTINRRSERVQHQQSYLSTLAQEAFSGIRVLKAYNREKRFAANFSEESEEYKRRSLRLVKVNALFFPIILLLIGLSTILSVYIGGLKTISGQITIGNIAEFVIYVNMLTWPFAAIGWVTSLVQRAAASMERIREFLDFQPEIVNKPGAETREIRGKVAFKNVSFTYPDSGVQALKDVSFTIEEGQTLAIVGRTGSGKSTIANLLCRLYEPDSGEITIDDLPTDRHELYNLRTSIGYVPQDVFLFSDTIANNIRFGMKQDIDEAQMIQAAHDAEIHDNIAAFKNGYETLVGERGITLSGGQKQRVSIARAIIKKPAILIFDDSLSAVDTETEDRILTNLKRIMENRTTVLVSHRISTAKNADHILVLDDGQIVESGTHKSLVEKGGVYFDMHQKQLLEDTRMAS